MLKYWKKYRILILVVLALILVGVAFGIYFSVRKNPIPKPAFATQEYNNGFCKFEIPADWEVYTPAKTEPQPDMQDTENDMAEENDIMTNFETKNDEDNTESLSEGHREEGMITEEDNQQTATEQMLFIPKGANTEQSVSNINVNLSKVAGRKTSIRKMYQEFEESFETSITDLYPNSHDFTFSDYKAPNHKVFMTNYVLETGQTTAKCVQYYPIIKDYVLVITTANVGDNLGEGMDKIAEHMINTFEFVK